MLRRERWALVMPVSGPQPERALCRLWRGIGAWVVIGTKEAKRWDLGAEEPRQRSLRLRRVELSKGGQTPL